MSLFVLIGIAAATVTTSLYAIIALYNKRRPELNEAVVIFLGVGGVVSAVRIIGAVLSGEFSMIVPESHKGVWSLVPDDAIQIVLGGVSLAWVSIQTITSSFKTACGRRPPSAPRDLP